MTGLGKGGGQGVPLHGGGDAGGGGEAPQPVQQVGGCQLARLGRRAASPLGQGGEAAQHVDEQTRQGEVAPFRIGAGVDQHHPAPAAPQGGDQGGTVGQRRPGTLRQLQSGLGQHLRPDFHVVGDGEAMEGRRFGEGGEAHGRRPRQHAAQGAPAREQGDGKQRVADGALGDQRPGETHQHAALLDPCGQLEGGGAGGQGQIGQDDHVERRIGGQLRRLAPLQLGMGRQGPLHVIEAVEQRRRRGIAAGHPHRAPPAAFIQQQGGAGRMLALDLQAGQPVAQRGRQVDGDLGGGAAGLEAAFAPGQHHALGIQRPHRHRLGLRCRQAAGDGGQTLGGGAGLGRQQQTAAPARHHIQFPSQALQPAGQGGISRVGQSVAQPYHPPGAVKGQGVQRLDGGSAVGGPRPGLHARRQGAGLGGRHQPAQGDGAAIGGRRGVQQQDRAAGALGGGQQSVQMVVAPVPVPRRGPAVVDHHQ